MVGAGEPMPDFQGEQIRLRRRRGPEEQTVTIPREADKRPIAEVTKKHEISDRTIYT
jgi:hypothetical protein